MKDILSNKKQQKPVRIRVKYFRFFISTLKNFHEWKDRSYCHHRYYLYHIVMITLLSHPSLIMPSMLSPYSLSSLPSLRLIHHWTHSDGRCLKWGRIEIGDTKQNSRNYHYYYYHISLRKGVSGVFIMVAVISLFIWSQSHQTSSACNYCHYINYKNYHEISVWWFIFPISFRLRNI